MKRTLVVTDIHGAFKALEQVLDRAKFDPELDTLIMMGDVCDGWKYTTECIELLRSFPNLIQLMGNHDYWCYMWLKSRINGTNFSTDEYIGWTRQGGQATLTSLETHNSYDMVYKFLDKSKAYHLDHKNRLFVHGGVQPTWDVEDTPLEALIWDRQMVQIARGASMGSDPVIEKYAEVYCGHTPTIFMDNRREPIHYSNVWMCDTGASYDGMLSILNIDSRDVWQSDPVVDLYPNEKAR